MSNHAKQTVNLWTSFEPCLSNQDKPELFGNPDIAEREAIAHKMEACDWDMLESYLDDVDGEFE